MEKLEFLKRYVDPFQRVQFEFLVGKGYIVWRLGTGNNIELLHVGTFEKRKGHGRRLFYKMLDRIKEDRKPYYSIFGFTIVGNEEAQAFYGELGFKLQTVEGIYENGKAVLFYQSYEVLLRVRSEYDAHCLSRKA